MTNRHEGPSSGEDLEASQSQPVLLSNEQPEAVNTVAFTPGPWRYGPNPKFGYASDCSAWEVRSPDDDGEGYVVAAVITDVSELADAGEANARLIAAAPALLDALEHLVTLFVDLAPLGENTTREVAVVNARKALAKALGDRSEAVGEGKLRDEPNPLGPNQ